MMTVKKEIRQILLGYISFQDKCIVAVEGVFRMRSLGLFSNSSAARVFGVAERVRRYRIPKKHGEELRSFCEKHFRNLGRRVLLKGEPDMSAVLYVPILFSPSVLTAAEEDKGILAVRVYTARSLTAWITVSHAFRVWQKQLPEGSERIKADQRTKKEKAPRKKRHNASENQEAAVKDTKDNDRKADNGEFGEEKNP